MYIKANSPAVFAEKYLIQSIWNNHYPQGSILPAERELSELIGVTRTTLREVLQRLARDGWITIQHGKPTQVNDFMQTAGLNILDTLLTLEGVDFNAVLNDLLTARSDIGTSFMQTAIAHYPQESSALISGIIKNCEYLQKSGNIDDFLELVTETDEIQIHRELKTIPSEYKEDPAFYHRLCLAKAFNYCDYRLFQGMAMTSGNRVYLLTMNGMRKIYSRIGGYYFQAPNAREAALNFYKELLKLCETAQGDKVKEVIRHYGRESRRIWDENREKVRNYLAQE